MGCVDFVKTSKPGEKAQTPHIQSQSVGLEQTAID